MPSDSDKIEIENVNSPGRVERVDRAKYVAMKKALLSVLPKTSPGVPVAALHENEKLSVAMADVNNAVHVLRKFPYESTYQLRI